MLWLAGRQPFHCDGVPQMTIRSTSSGNEASHSVLFVGKHSNQEDFMQTSSAHAPATPCGNLTYRLTSCRQVTESTNLSCIEQNRLWKICGGEGPR